MACGRGPASAGRAPVLSLTSRCLARRSDTGARRRLMRRRARRLTAERARRGLRRPRAPSRTYFPREDCVFLRMTEGRPQSSAGKRSSRSRSTFPILHCAPQRELSWVNTSEGTPGETVMPALTPRAHWSALWCSSVSGAASGGADDASVSSTPRPTGSASAEAARTTTPTRSNAVRSPGRTRRPLPGFVQHR